MKNFIKEFIPPIIYKRFNLLKKSDNQNSYQKFHTYQDALKLCVNDAYREEELTEIVLKKTKKFITDIQSGTIPIWETSAYSLVSLLNPIAEKKESQTINVLDFGGACGAHYFHLRKLIDKKVKLKWVVVETPTMVKFAKELETNELLFVDELLAATNILGEIDLLHTSGTLQSVDDPHKYLNDIVNCNAKWLLLNRLGLNILDRDVITTHASKLSQNGIGEMPEGHTDRLIEFIYTFPSEKKIIAKIEDKYLITAKFNDQSGMYKITGEEIIGYGLLCSLKA